MNVLLVGEEAAGAQTLKTLLATRHKLVAVMASETKAAPRGGNLWTIARNLGCVTWPAKLVKDATLADRIRAEQVDLLLNVHSLFVINRDVVAAPRLGAFNMHPGPLPRYAGLNAPSWAVYRGETSHGVTVHWMLAGIDTGPIAYQALFDVTEEDTGLTVSTKCVRAGLPLVSQLLDTAASDPQAIPKVEQDLSKREYFGRDVPNQGFIDWTGSTREILNLVRACDYLPFVSPWGMPRTLLGDQELGVAKAARTGIRCHAIPGTVGQASRSGVQIACGDEWLLITSIKVNDQYLLPAESLTPGTRLMAQTPAKVH